MRFANQVCKPSQRAMDRPSSGPLQSPSHLQPKEPPQSTPLLQPNPLQPSGLETMPPVQSAE